MDAIEAYQKKIAPSGGRMLAETSLKEAQELQRKLGGGLTPIQTEGLYKEIRQKSVLPMVTNITDSGKQLNYVDQVFARGDTREIASVISNFARIVAGEKGVLTDRDITRQLPDSFQKIKEDVIAFFKAGGTYNDPRILQGVKSLTAMMREATRKAYNEKIHSQIKTYQHDPFMARTGMNVEEAYGGAIDALTTNFGAYESIADFELRRSKEAKQPPKTWPKPHTVVNTGKTPKLSDKEKTQMMLDIAAELKRRKEAEAKGGK
jgi:hypothetical protein